MACFIAPCKSGANKNPRPILFIHSFTLSGVISIFTPSAFNTSALPHSLVTPLLPCFATFKPEALATKPAAVEILNAPSPLPPVPHVSITFPFTLILVAFSRITIQAPVISSVVSPFILKAVIKLPI